MTKISTFDDWIDYFHQWQKDIGYDAALLGDYKFETKLGELHSPDIEFGDFKGQQKWQRVGQIPNQSIRDALMNLIVYQGDTEFASVEQQKNLLDTAPTEYDRKALIRVNSEEMRHGWQMCYLLVNYFGDSGKLEARKMLERRAFRGDRLLGSFNAPVNNWLDFFTYTEFVDRDGKYQLTMLSHSSFAPLAESVTAMLKEEHFPHVHRPHRPDAGAAELRKIPVPIVQKYFNKWLSTAYDLFGTDQFFVSALGLHMGHQRPLRRTCRDRAGGERQAQRSRPRTLYARIATANRSAQSTGAGRPSQTARRPI